MADRSKLAEILSALNHLSQIGLLALACFGYFYTVRPLYSKALLEEQIAEKELMLKKLNIEMSETKTEATIAQGALARLQAQVQRETDLLAVTSRKLVAAQAAISAKEFEIAKVTEQADINYKKSRTVALESLKTSISFRCMGLGLRGSDDVEIDPKTPDAWAECLEKTLSSYPQMQVFSASDKESIAAQLMRSAKEMREATQPIVAAANETLRKLTEQLRVTRETYAAKELSATDRQQRSNLVTERIGAEYKIRRERSEVRHAADKRMLDLLLEHLRRLTL